MWPFSKRPTLEELRGYKKVTVQGMRFTIRRVNPLLDFRSDQIPQLFTDFQSGKAAPALESTPERIKKLQEDMHAVILAGVVEPKLVPNGKEGGFTPDDLFRNPAIGAELYTTILDHSFNQFKGLKKLFFSIRTKYRSYITWRKHTGYFRTKFSSRMAARAI